MKTTYTLDTNMVSYLLRGEGNVEANFQRNIITLGNEYAIPFIVYYEAKRWLNCKPTKQSRLFAHSFDALFKAIKKEAEMDIDIWDMAVQIHIDLTQQGQIISDADILIAAYCVSNDYILVTRNTNDFKRIGNLKIVNWFD